MARESAPPDPTLSPNRLWAEQLAMGLVLLVALLIFLAIFHPNTLQAGAEVLGQNDMDAYGLASIIGVVLQVVVHEAGSIFALRVRGIPVRFRFFGFGANASASLEAQPRHVWTDAVIGLAGPMTGTLVSALLSVIYEITKLQDASMDVGNPFFLGMACVGFFYNLFTLIPILDLEGGWIAPAIAPQAWLLGLVAVVLELTTAFNLVLLGVACFALPRFIQLLRARVPRTDLACTPWQRVVIALMYFVLVVGLAWYGSTLFDELPKLVRESKGD